MRERSSAVSTEALHRLDITPAGCSFSVRVSWISKANVDEERRIHENRRNAHWTRAVRWSGRVLRRARTANWTIYADYCGSCRSLDARDHLVLNRQDQEEVHGWL